MPIRGLDLRQRVELSGTLETFPSDPTISVESVPGTKLGEAMMTVRSNGRSSLMFSDVIQNNPKESTALLFRMMGFGGGPKVHGAAGDDDCRLGSAGRLVDDDVAQREGPPRDQDLHS